jgi:hypothetical protein
VLFSEYDSDVGSVNRKTESFLLLPLSNQGGGFIVTWKVISSLVAANARRPDTLYPVP